jgi:signal peptide peptidase SppA
MNNLISAWTGRPLAIRPENLTALLSLDQNPTAGPNEATRFSGRRSPAGLYTITDAGVALIQILGPLVNRGAWIGPSWFAGQSYEGVSAQLEAATRDPSVGAIILDIESPGGEAVGAFETAALIRKCGEAKPIFAMVNGMAASAAYALASGCKAIISTPTGLSGSIGVVLLHADYSRAIDQAGITPTLIHAGAHKVDGNPYQPLPSAVRSDLQNEIDKYHAIFCSTVEDGRGARLSAAAAKATQAKTYVGEAARGAGLVDDIGVFSELLTEAEIISKRRKGAAMAIDLSKYDTATTTTTPVPRSNPTPKRAENDSPIADISQPPRQPGAVAWADIVEAVNREASGARTIPPARAR